MRQDVRIALKPRDRYFWAKTSVYRLDREEMVFHTTTWRDGEAQLESDAFAAFVLLTDTIAPQLLRVKKLNSRRLRFYVSDDISGLHSWSATLNGEWLLMEYVQKHDFLQTRPLSSQDLSEGTISLVLKDKQNNVQTYTYTLKP